MDNGKSLDTSMPLHIQYNDVVYALRLFLAIVIPPVNPFTNMD